MWRRFACILCLSSLLTISGAFAADEYFRLTMGYGVAISGGTGHAGVLTVEVGAQPGWRASHMREVPLSVDGMDASHVLVVDGLPAGMTWIQDPLVAGKGVVSGAPTMTGTSAIMIRVLDAAGEEVESWTVALEVVGAVSATVPPVNVYELDESISIAPEAGNVLGGEEGSASWVLVPEDALPDWLHFEPTTGSISGVAEEALDLEDLLLTVVDAADGDIGSSNPFSIVVNALPGGNWVSTLSGSDAFGVASGADGSIYVVGTTGPKLLLMKLDSAGAVIWKKTVTTSNVAGRAVTVGSDGSVYVVGHAAVAGQVNDVFVAKFTDQGALSWAKTLGLLNSISSDWGNSIARAEDGDGVYVGGYFSNGGYGEDLFIGKISANGAWRTLPSSSTKWQRRLRTDVDSGSYERANSLAVVNGSIYAGGRTTNGYGSPWFSGNNGILSSFGVAWGGYEGTVIVGGTGADEIKALASGGGGTILAGGSMGSAGPGEGTAYVAKFQQGSAVPLWRKMIGASAASVEAMAVGADGIYAVGQGFGGVLVAKFDDSGSAQWGGLLDFGGVNAALARGVVVDGDALIVVGSTGSQGFVARVPTSGVEDVVAGSYSYSAIQIVDTVPASTAVRHLQTTGRFVGEDSFLTMNGYAASADESTASGSLLAFEAQ